MALSDMFMQTGVISGYLRKLLFLILIGGYPSSFYPSVIWGESNVSGAITTNKSFDKSTSFRLKCLPKSFKQR